MAYGGRGGFTKVAFQDGQTPADKAIWDEIAAAVAEREEAVIDSGDFRAWLWGGLGGGNFKTVGDSDRVQLGLDLQVRGSHSNAAGIEANNGIRGLQRAIEEVACRSYLRSRDTSNNSIDYDGDAGVSASDANGSDATDSPGLEGELPSYTIQTLAESMHNPEGRTVPDPADSIFRATTVHPDDPAFTDWEYRVAEAGDIIGDWMFDDIQEAILRMEIVKNFDQGGATTVWDLDRAGDNEESWSNTDSTCPDAQAGLTSDGTSRDASSPPLAIGKTTTVFSDFRASADTRENQLKAQPTGDGTLKADVQFWIRATKPTGGTINQFDTQGYDVQDELWSRFDTTSGITPAADHSTEFHSRELVDYTVQPTPPDCGDVSSGDNVWHGWIEGMRAVTVDFTVTGGFTHQF